MFIVNGWDNAVDNNRSKSIGGQLALMTGTGVTLYVGAIFGPELAEDNSDNRTVVDLAGSYAAASFLTVGLNGDYGTEERAASDGGAARWDGAAVYLRFTLSDQFALTVRGERFEDQDGTRTGAAQKVYGVTLTPEFRVLHDLVVRGDVRLDVSSGEVFEKAGGITDNQLTVSVNVLFVY
jgi:hypothetical protein